LLVIIDNLLRRLEPAQNNTPAKVTPPSVGQDLGWSFDIVKRQITITNGDTAILTHAESMLLQAMLRAAPKPASRKQLIEAIGGRIHRIF
jgi:DNA-binding response OmpR family regulator